MKAQLSRASLGCCRPVKMDRPVSIAPFPCRPSFAIATIMLKPRRSELGQLLNGRWPGNLMDFPYRVTVKERQGINATNTTPLQLL